MQYKPANWVTGFKRSPRAANVQNRDMGLFLNSSGKFEPIDDAWDSIHSGGLFISGDNKLYFRDETNKDIYINSPTAETLVLGAGNATTAGFITINEEGFDTDFRVEASGVANALFVRGSDGAVGIGTTPAASYTKLHAYGSSGFQSIRVTSNTIDIDLFANSTGTRTGLYVTDNAPMDFYTNDILRQTISADGNVGIGADPGTLLELNGTAPYLTIKNSTHEDGDGDREGRIIFEGEQSGGEISTLAQIQASHDGTSDDQKGDLIFYTNDGSDGASPTERLRIDSAGYVGIGANDPSVGLEIEGGSNTAAKIGIINTAPSPDNSWSIHAQYNDQTLRFLGDSTTVLQMVDTGEVGIGATPGTLLELFGTAPYLTLRNSTHEDGDGGRESKIIFEGEQSGGEDSTLAVIQASHDGTSDDQKGDLIFYTNDGSDNAAPTEAMRIDSAQNVGIGETSPNMELTVVNANDTAANPIAGFYTNNKSVGLIVDYKGIRAADVTADGSTALDANQDIRIDAKGTGIIRLGQYANSDVNIANGNLVIGTAGKGIDFSAQTSPAAGMASELLDRYEEGTWTGVISDGTNNATMAGTATTGTYTRVGNMVTVTGYLRTSSLGSVSGGLRLTGLPFTVFNNNRAYGGVAVSYGLGLNITAGHALGGNTAINTTYINLNIWDDTAGTTIVTDGEWTADGGIIMTASYMVS